MNAEHMVNILREYDDPKKMARIMHASCVRFGGPSTKVKMWSDVCTILGVDVQEASE
ncbi:MAG: hypothetical protein FWD92_02370 [Methanomassiliicoccaceae archaeon]|nr:hypothetical protein [Methanomassiliicoccaceae archaeon]